MIDSRLGAQLPAGQKTERSIDLFGEPRVLDAGVFRSRIEILVLRIVRHSGPPLGVQPANPKQKVYQKIFVWF